MIAISIFSIRYSNRIKVHPTTTTGAFMGMIAGIGNGLFGIGGPPVALYLLSAQDSKESYLATIQCYFLLSNLSTIVIRTGHGALAWSDVPFVLAGWTGIATGTFIGLKVFQKISHHMLRRLVYGFVGISGVVIILQQIS